MKRDVFLAAMIATAKRAGAGAVVDTPQVSSFVLILPAGMQPPALPWEHELKSDNPRAARWCRLTNEVHGDGAWFVGEIYGLVVDGRDVGAVIGTFHELELAEGQSATLHAHRAGDDAPECYRRERFHGMSTRGHKL